MERRATKETPKGTKETTIVNSLSPNPDCEHSTSPVELADLAGRWVAVVDGQDQGLILITDAQEVVFIGDQDPQEMRLSKFEDAVCRFRIQTLDGTVLCDLKADAGGNGQTLLHISATDGTKEVWHRTGIVTGVAKPRAVRVERSWTKHTPANPVNLPAVAGSASSGVCLGVTAVAGRWVAVAEGEDQGLILIQESGEVLFIGDPDPQEMFLRSIPDRPEYFTIASSSGFTLCTVRAEVRSEIDMSLHISASDGTEEVWHRTGIVSGVTASASSNANGRKWTKQAPVAHSDERAMTKMTANRPPGFMCAAGTVNSSSGQLPLGAHELAGRWIAVADGQDQGLIIIQESGEVVFVGDADPQEMHVAALGRVGTFQLVTVGGEKMCEMLLDVGDDGKLRLQIEATDGTQEVWHRTGVVDGVKKSATMIEQTRRWSKQAGRDSIDEDRRWTKRMPDADSLHGADSVACDWTFVSPSPGELAGRWLAIADGADKGMILIECSGEVIFVGDADPEELRLIASSAERGQLQIVSADAESVCKLTAQVGANGAMRLNIDAVDGTTEIWHRTGIIEGVAAQSVKADRRWTKQKPVDAFDSAASTKSTAAHGADATHSSNTVAIAVGLAHLAGHWTAVADGETQGMILIDCSGAVSFIGEEPQNMRLLPVVDGPGLFQLQSVDGELLADLQAQGQQGHVQLRAFGVDGTVEIWQRSDVPGATATLGNVAIALEQPCVRLAVDAVRAGRVRDCFKSFDELSGGKIDAIQFSNVFQSLDNRLTPEAIASLIQAAGAHVDDRTVDYDQFLRWLFMCSAPSC